MARSALSLSYGLPRKNDREFLLITGPKVADFTPRHFGSAEGSIISLDLYCCNNGLDVLPSKPFVVAGLSLKMLISL